MKQLIVVEFSLIQNCFHKHTVGEMLNKNLFNIESKTQTDFLPIGIFGTHDEADDFISEMKEKL